MSLKHIKEGIDDWYKEQEFRYPDRHKEIHSKSCKNCPSEKPCDQMEEEYDSHIKTLPLDVIAKEHLFVCYMRPNKLCKGCCDKAGVNQEQLNTIYNEHF